MAITIAAREVLIYLLTMARAKSDDIFQSAHVNNKIIRLKCMRSGSGEERYERSSSASRCNSKPYQPEIISGVLGGILDTKAYRASRASICM